MKKYLFLIFSCLFILLIITCSNKQNSESATLMAVDYSQWEIGKPGGEINISHEGDPKSFNVIVTNDTASTDVVDRVFDPIVERNTLTLEWEARLAESWELSDDGLSVIFTLRKDLKWSDGQPITAEDIVFTVNKIIYNEKVEAQEKDSFYVGKELVNIEKVDDMKFKITTPSIYADIVRLANFQPVPKHILEPLIQEKGIEAVNSFWGADTEVKNIVGSGPFVISEYVPNQRIILKKNPYYWRKDEKGQRQPYLDRINLVIVEDRNTAFLKLMAGELDAIEFVRGEDVTSILEKKTELNLEIYDAGPRASTNFITFNQNYNHLKEPKLSWFNNQKFRQAVAHLIDRQTIVENIYFGFATPQYSFVPRFSPLYWEQADEVAYKYDPAKAKKILKEIGMEDKDGDGIREDKDGNRVSFILQTNSDNTVRVKIGEILSQEMKKAGLDVTFKPGDFKTLVKALTSTYDWDAIIIGLTGSLQPFLSGSNVYPSRGSLHMIEPKQQSPRRDWEKQVDALYIENTTTVDLEKRKQTGYKLQELWVKNLPWIYTVNETAICVFNKKYSNVKPRNVSPFDSWKGICEFLYVKD